MIKIHDLWKKYGKTQVLKGLSLDIEDGETLVILGRSGVGKSVLLKQIIGLEKPDQGYVEIDGIVITDLSISERYKRVKKMGMLFQGAALFDSMNVGENIAFYLRQHEYEIGEKKIQERVSEALEMVGMEGTQNKMPSDLSGGMKKRAGLARLIAYRPRILLYDEPTTGLDPITAMQINELIISTQSQLKATSIVVTHDIQSALKIGNRLALHSDGKIARIGPAKDFFQIDDPVIHAFYKNSILSH